MRTSFFEAQGNDAAFLKPSDPVAGPMRGILACSKALSACCALSVFVAVASFGPSHVAAQSPPLAIFAGETNRPVGSDVIDMSSGNSTITGRIHCNSDIDVSGTGNYFRTGVVQHVTGIYPVPNFQGKVTLQNCPV